LKKSGDRHLDVDEITELGRLFAEGLMLREAAAQSGRSVATVSKYFAVFRSGGTVRDLCDSHRIRTEIFIRGGIKE
jgi:hypothetical protein